MSSSELRSIVARYGSNVIPKNLNFQMERGELVPLLGSSDCDRTTTLRLIAGFSNPMSGTFTFDDKDYIHVPLYKKDFGFVFQNYALFPHMIIFGNVAFGLKMQKMSSEQMKKEVMDILETVDLVGFKNRLPKEISGGQRQRVAPTRALAIRPNLLLLDEPLSNLDAELRVKVRVGIRKLQQKSGFMTICVTHDQEECFTTSDKVAIVNKSIIEQMDTPLVIHNHPNTEFITHFMGFRSFIDLTKTEGADIYRVANGRSARMMSGETGEHFKIRVRPEGTQVAPVGMSVVNGIPGEITVNTSLDKQSQYNAKTDTEELEVSMDQENVYRGGNRVILPLAPNKIILP